MEVAKRRKKLIAGKEVMEHCVYFIQFMDREEEKWCHAMIDEISEDHIIFRVAANAKPIMVKLHNVLDVLTSEKEKCFDEDTLKALYRGEIFRRKLDMEEYLQRRATVCENCAADYEKKIEAFSQKKKLSGSKEENQKFDMDLLYCTGKKNELLAVADFCHELLQLYSSK